MTSIPASRRARAMILAPRSCPSRPGLATTTRIFLLLVPASTRRASLLRGRDHLEDRRLGVGPEDLLERGHDLALAGVRARALDDRLDQVGVARRRLLEPPERRLDLRAGAARAHRREPPYLLALERGVDPQDLDRLLRL